MEQNIDNHSGLSKGEMQPGQASTIDILFQKYFLLYCCLFFYWMNISHLLNKDKALI